MSAPDSPPTLPATREGQLLKREAFASGRCSALHERCTIADDEGDEERNPCEKCRLAAKRFYPLPPTEVPNEVVSADGAYAWRVIGGALEFQELRGRSAKWKEWSTIPSASRAAIADVLLHPTKMETKDE